MGDRNTNGLEILDFGFWILDWKDRVGIAHQVSFEYFYLLPTPNSPISPDTLSQLRWLIAPSRW